MPNWNEVIQVGDEISYPDGFNQITVEGTGDEGSLKTSRYPSISITASPANMSSDGIATSIITASVTDYDDLEFYRVQELVEDITSTSLIEVAVGKYIVAIEGTLSTLEEMGIYEYDGSTDINGKPIPGAKLQVDPFKPFYRQRIKLAVTRVAGQTSRYLVIYKGVAATTFNVGAENTTWYPIEEFPPVDPPWTPTNPSEPGGTILPSLCPFGSPGLVPGTWVESTQISGGYERDFVEFMPDRGSAGVATVNVNYKGYKNSVRITVADGDPLGDASIRLQAEPSSIEIRKEDSVVECVVVTADNTDPGPVGVTFDLYSSPAPPEWGNVVWKGGREATLGLVTKSVETNSSDNLTISVNYLIDAVLDIVAVPEPTDTWTWTWNNTCVIEGTMIHLSEGNELPLDATPVEVKCRVKGVAQTIVYGSALGRCILVGRIKDKTPTCDVTVTAEGGPQTTDDFQLAAEPTTLDFNQESVVTATYTGTPRHTTYELVPASKEAHRLHDEGGALGTFYMPSLPAESTLMVEVQTPSDLRTVKVDKPINSIVDIETVTGRHPAVQTINVDTITFTHALATEDFQAMTITYYTGAVATGWYRSPNNKMSVLLVGKLYKSDIVRSVQIDTNLVCKSWEVEIVSCEPDILDAAGDKKPAKIYPGDQPAVVHARLTEPHPTDETLDRIPSPNIWLKLFVDPDISKSFEGRPGAMPGRVVHLNTGAVPPSYPGYIIVKTADDGSFSFGLEPATGQGRTIVTVVVTDQKGDETECSISTGISYETSQTSLDQKTVAVVLGRIQVTLKGQSANRSGSINGAGEMITLTSGDIASFGILEEAASHGGFTTQDPRESPVHITYVVPKYYSYFIKRIYLKDSAGDFLTFGGDTVKFLEDKGQDNTWPGPIGPAFNILYIPSFRRNTYDYSFTIVNEARPTEVVPGARVELVAHQDALGRSVAYSDSGGKVSFNGLTAGETYTIYITSEGFRANSIDAAIALGDPKYDDDTDNDTLTIPQYGYSERDKFIINDSSKTIEIWADVYDTSIAGFEDETEKIG